MNTSFENNKFVNKYQSGETNQVEGKYDKK